MMVVAMAMVKGTVERMTAAVWWWLRGEGGVGYYGVGYYAMGQGGLKREDLNLVEYDMDQLAKGAARCSWMKTKNSGLVSRVIANGMICCPSCSLPRIPAV
ncbi:hypothetical protein Droror1_Dr00019993 [Drosera rotundifolia]